MKLSTSILSSVLFASAAVAAPSTLAERVQARKERRANPGSSHLPIPAPDSAGFATEPGNATLYYTNWSGGIIQSPPSGTTFFAIDGSFVVPEPAPPVSGAGTWYGTAWVGIYDNNAILQSGVDWGVTVSSSGAYSYQYNAWWEWYPNGWTDYNLVVNAGDQISVLCDAGSTSSANCLTVNQNTGDQVSQTLTAPSSSSTLQATSAAWIVEDFSSGGLVPFANFGTVTFTDCTAVAGVNFANGQNLYPNSGTATPADIVASSGSVITAVTFPEDTSNIVEVTYI
ncbi:concanavalin A-like lectin/glucanase [Mollisia scopiformis]|uniref:Concanavalin A-like lectin/glucanase n=1 Tax=Mollisia scopiformis TaxID=149040 RepID=A0A194WWJ1_MOLSC|nr:concanavalin A-like lectin/glucanase [Mollisia scopiformis]KUJ12343.1 concanavalin A-like lectin/glucanase [Mollisia scopiformis]